VGDRFRERARRVAMSTNDSATGGGSRAGGRSAALPVVLVVEDEALVRADMEGLIGDTCEVLTAGDGAEALRVAEASLPDLVLLDVMLPSIDGFEVCRRLRASARLREVPVVMLTALGDRASRLRGLEAGADDFVSKPFDRAELAARIATITRLNRYRRLYEQQAELGAGRAEFEALLASAPMGITLLDADLRFRRINEFFAMLAGRPAAELVGLGVNAHPPLATSEPTLRRVIADAVVSSGEEIEVKLGGRLRSFALTVFPVPAADGRAGVGVVANEVTGTKDLTARLILSQKMEVVGRLAGGVAHDFNNLLTVVLGSANFLKEGIPADDPMREDVDEILAAGNRAAELTRQLLTFARKQVASLREVDLEAVVLAEERLVRKMIAEDVSTVFEAGGGPAPVLADPSQVRQLLLNLALNAREAMPNGGRITVRVRLVDLPGGGRVGAPAGRYAALSVRDAGVGMRPEVLTHLFEPFYTTKQAGQGTGLGLASVYGIVEEHGGELAVESAPGEGTTFTAYFPILAAHRDDAAPVERLSVPATGTILLVEDEPAIRSMLDRTLRAAGWSVVAVASPFEALARWSSVAAVIDGVLTDVVMPGMAGPEMIEILRRERPDLFVVFMSGYTEHQAVGLTGAHTFLPKPFTPAELLDRVQRASRRA
jgi:two-component system cell cycle sensor histidine kinase/response regulator CckA